MKRSNYYIPTQKEIPQNAEIKSHILMIKGGYIRKLAAGVYTILPIGQKILLKIADIIRKHMNRAGFHELLMPILSPKELWQETGRYDVYGKEMMKLSDRHNREFVLGPTHEEIVTDLVRKTIKSYKELPLGLYQIQTKFRDEIRPRFGIMRGREFLMKDAYSFDSSYENAIKTYKKVEKAYNDIFTELDLEFSEVEAQSGAIGGSTSKEFMVHAEVGESTILTCSKCGYSSNIEKTEVVHNPNEKENYKELEMVHTPKMKTVEEVANYLNIPINKIVKTILLKNDKNEYFAVLIRGDRDLNMEKLNGILNEPILELASDEDFKKIGSVMGFIGPINIKVNKIIADLSIKGLCNFVVGANKNDYHYINVNFNRDLKIKEFFDIAFAKSGDPCPKCGGPLKSFRGIEVGHIFVLGNKYSKSMDAYFIDENGKKQYYEMGCYGIGVGRTMAAVIEQKYNEKTGMYWPLNIAPFEVEILPLNVSDNIIMENANKLYDYLISRNIDVIMDDRDINIGVKFAESDLLGVPFKIVIGKKFKDNNKFEVVYRKDNEKRYYTFEELINFLMKFFEKRLK